MFLRVLTSLPATLLFTEGEKLNEWYVKALLCGREWLPVMALGSGEDT